MTLLTGLTAQGVEVPIRVDDQGRLIAVAPPDADVPTGGVPGQLLAKVGPVDYETGWVDDQGAALARGAFGIRAPLMIFVPNGTTPQPLLFPNNVQSLNGATFNPATGRITPTVAGHWWITASSRVGTAMTVAKLRLRFNTSDVGSATRTAPQADCPVLLSAHYFGFFNGTTDSILAEVVHGNAASLGYDQNQICGFLLPPP